MKKRIVCYGDSNTWGFTPITGERYDETIRWPSLLQTMLGNEYQVIECGINARTTSYDDPYGEFLNGRKGIEFCLAENMPIDILIISLGTNDLKFCNAQASSFGLDALLYEVERVSNGFWTRAKVFAPGYRIIVISPIHLHKTLDNEKLDRLLAGKYGESLRLCEFYKLVADKHHVEFLDASQYASPSDEDGIHMTPKGHRNFANAVITKIRTIDMN